MTGTPGAARAPGSVAFAARRYRRREPERSLLHKVVRGHWKTLLAEVAQRTDGGSCPGFVLAEFERYLACGILANGFARVRCGACKKELLVALSCKGRGLCPSCTTRRMQGTAIHLVEHVLPAVPTRQWVFSLPRWARFMLARDPALITRTLDHERKAVQSILEHLGIPTTGPPLAPARGALLMASEPWQNDVPAYQQSQR